jgi:hypothetical protein
VVTIISGAYGPLNVFFLALAVAGLGVDVWAFIDAVMRPTHAYLAAGKLTKTKWLLILGVALVLGLYGAAYGVGIGNIFLPVIAFVAAAIYLSDVRPRLREFKKGTTTHSGPYGPW